MKAMVAISAIIAGGRLVKLLSFFTFESQSLSLIAFETDCGSMLRTE